jgi:HSP20 family molecular chaperone IbpA
MSLARHFFRELRPVINMLEDPLARSSSYYGMPSRSVFDHPFFHSPETFRPALDLTEEGNSYILEADLPGVKRENLEVRVGEGGRSITIEGKIVSRRNRESVVESKEDSGTNDTTTPAEGSSNGTSHYSY